MPIADRCNWAGPSLAATMGYESSLYRTFGDLGGPGRNNGRT